MIKEMIVKYGRLLLDISVVVEIIGAFLFCVIAAAITYGFVGFLLGIISFIVAVMFIILFNYFIYILIDIRDNFEKFANKQL